MIRCTLFIATNALRVVCTTARMQVERLTPEQLLSSCWQEDCLVLVMPGGADLPYCRLLNGRGNRLIRGGCALRVRMLSWRQPASVCTLPAYRRSDRRCLFCMVVHQALQVVKRAAARRAYCCATLWPLACCCCATPQTARLLLG